MRSFNYLLNPKWSKYPHLRIRVSVDLDLKMATVGMNNVRVIGRVKHMDAMLVDIVQHRESAWFPLSVLSAQLESVNFASTVETLLQDIMKKDGMR